MSERNDLNISAKSPDSVTPAHLAWASRPFRQFYDYVQELNDIVQISTRGISLLEEVPGIFSALMTSGDTYPSLISDINLTEEELEVAKREAELAGREVKRGFPLLYSQALVSHWGIFESTMQTFYATWLENEPKAMQATHMQKLKVPLSEYESLDKADRCVYIVDLLQRDLQTPLKQGVSRFETVLDVFGLGGDFDDAGKRDIYEMSQLRNVIVHRRGIADKKLIQACPWLQLKVGDPVIVTRDRYFQLSHVTLRYATEIMIRIAVHFGQNREEFVKRFTAKMHANLASPG